MIIYTCITNGYDEIPDHYYDPDVQYVCFTDGTVEKKGPWEFRDILVDHKCLEENHLILKSILIYIFLLDLRRHGLMGVM